MGRSLRTLALAVLCIAAQLAAGVHAVAVAHTRCAEHGEVVHGEAHQHAVTVDDVAHATIDDGAAPPAGEDEHEHCASRSLPRVAEPGFRLPAVIAAPALPVPAPPAAAPPRSARPLYRLAPKASPPAAA